MKLARFITEYDKLLDGLRLPYFTKQPMITLVALYEGRHSTGKFAAFFFQT